MFGTPGREASAGGEVPVGCDVQVRCTGVHDEVPPRIWRERVSVLQGPCRQQTQNDAAPYFMGRAQAEGHQGIAEGGPAWAAMEH